MAVGSEQGTLGFTDLVADDQNAAVTGSAPGITVAVQRLSDILRDVPSIDLLKIDVEGYEKYALQGAAGILPRVQCIFFELVDQNYRRYGYSGGDVIQFLNGHGFEVFRREADQRITRVLPTYRSRDTDENLFGVRDVPAFLARTSYRLGE